MGKLNIPRLRFINYSDDWLSKKYSSIFSFKNTNSLSRDKLNYKSGEVKNIHYGDIHKKFNTLFDINTENTPYINKDINLANVANENFCQVGDLVIADASEDYLDIGKTIEIINLNNFKVLAGLHTFLARPKPGEVALGFTGYLVQSNSVRNQVKKIAQGTKVLGLSSKRLGEVDLIIPSLPEQQKIASFLTAVDDKIQLLNKKKALLEQYKKGVMQKIFNQEIRFKDEDGKDYPDWEEKGLGEVFNNRVEKNSQETELLSVTINYGVKKHSEMDRHDNSNSDKSKYLSVKAGDLVYNSMRMWQGASGKSLYNGIVSPAYTVLEIKNKNNVDFFAYLFKLKSLIETFQKHSQGLTSDTWNLKYPKFKLIKIKSPDQAEQTKIAIFLSSVDDKINAVNDQITKTQTYKKGLLQQMFV